MEPLPPVDAPPHDRPATSTKTWTAHLSTWLPRVGQEPRDLVPVTVRALRMTIVLVVLCGVIFPLLVFAIGQVAFPTQANGSLVTDGQGHVVGSSLIGQQFTQPFYFHGRPSVVAYNGAGSGSSAIGPTNPQLLIGNGTQVTVAPGAAPPPGATPVPGKPHTYYVPGSYLGVTNYAAQFRKENGLSRDTPLPPDIVTASGSGLDPDISVQAAMLQVNRVVAARKLLGGANAHVTVDRVMALIAQHTEGRQLGFMGEQYVNVLDLNLSLDALYGSPPTQK
ncbi:MAG TPA: potassium-transporting ATPase subunit C [Ktedonobacterales bacterium]|nr:potassium-transporting ATPase subunit C [Ktedonobacterales bacterium]